MKTLREELEGSAFWHGQVCLVCDCTTEEEGREGDLCVECGEPLQDSQKVLAWLGRLEADEDVIGG